MKLFRKNILTNLILIIGFSTLIGCTGDNPTTNNSDVITIQNHDTNNNPPKTVTVEFLLNDIENNLKEIAAYENLEPVDVYKAQLAEYVNDNPEKTINIYDYAPKFNIVDGTMDLSSYKYRVDDKTIENLLNHTGTTDVNLNDLRVLNISDSIITSKSLVLIKENINEGLLPNLKTLNIVGVSSALTPVQVEITMGNLNQDLTIIQSMTTDFKNTNHITYTYQADQNLKPSKPIKPSNNPNSEKIAALFDNIKTDLKEIAKQENLPPTEVYKEVLSEYINDNPSKSIDINLAPQFTIVDGTMNLSVYKYRVNDTTIENLLNHTGTNDVNLNDLEVLNISDSIITSKSLALLKENINEGLLPNLKTLNIVGVSDALTPVQVEITMRGLNQNLTIIQSMSNNFKNTDHITYNYQFN